MLCHDMSDCCVACCHIKPYLPNKMLKSSYFWSHNVGISAHSFKVSTIMMAPGMLLSAIAKSEKHAKLETANNSTLVPHCVRNSGWNHAAEVTAARLLLSAILRRLTFIPPTTTPGAQCRNYAVAALQTCLQLIFPGQRLAPGYNCCSSMGSVADLSTANPLSAGGGKNNLCFG